MSGEIIMIEIAITLYCKIKTIVVIMRKIIANVMCTTKVVIITKIDQ